MAAFYVANRGHNSIAIFQVARAAVSSARRLVPTGAIRARSRSILPGAFSARVDWKDGAAATA